MKRKGQQNWISHKEHMGFYKIKFKLNGSQWAHQVKKIVIFLTIGWKCDFVSFGFNLSSWFWSIICYSQGRFRDSY